MNVSDQDLEALQVPKIFLASQTDEPFVTDARHMYAIASQPKERSLYPGNNHGTAIFGGDNGDGPALRILRFIERYAPPG